MCYIDAQRNPFLVNDERYFGGGHHFLILGSQGFKLGME
jgi:hypothetical protein